MAEIVGERQRLGQILVEAERAGERARDLGHLERMGEPRAVMVAFVEHEDLGLVLEAAERGRMDDAVAVAAERAAALADRLGDAAGRGCGPGRRRRAHASSQLPCILARLAGTARGLRQLTLTAGALNYPH